MVGMRARLFVRMGERRESPSAMEIVDCYVVRTASGKPIPVHEEVFMLHFLPEMSGTGAFGPPVISARPLLTTRYDGLLRVHRPGREKGALCRCDGYAAKSLPACKGHKKGRHS